MTTEAKIDSLNYVIIILARDEEGHLRSLISSILYWRIKPAVWVIVDDGSTDRTAEIVREFAKDYSWIKLVHHAAEGDRLSGSKVVRAFKYGEKFLPANYDFIVKLDVDATMEDDYFERLLEKFKGDPKLGIAGIYCGVRIGDRTLFNETLLYHVRGATKVCRREYFEQIGGLIFAD